MTAPDQSIEPEHDLPMTPERREFLSKLVKADPAQFAGFVPVTASVFIDDLVGSRCCTDDCCGPGSWCCSRANPYTKEEK